MAYYRNRYYHHSTDLKEPFCPLCNKPFRMYWKDTTELNGFSDTTTMRDKHKVHYFCIPGAKSLQQLNEERKHLK